MKKTMYGVSKEKAEPGAVIREDLPIPEVHERDVLVRVKATAICGTDLHIMAWTEYARQRVPVPMVFGHEFAGDVVAVGSKVTEVKIGDRVAGETHIPCNHCYQCKIDHRHICENMKIIGVHVPGSFAEYISFPVDCAYRIGTMDYHLGAVLEPMGVAVHGVDAADVGEKVVVINGCGPIGLMAVGAAKAFGAKRVIASDVIPAKLEVAKVMGADTVVDSSKVDAVGAVLAETKHGADVIIDYSGNLKAIQSGFEMLSKGGRYVMVGLANGRLDLDLTESIIYKEATIVGVTGRLMYKTWDQCAHLMNSDSFDIRPIINGVYPLRDYDKAFADIKAGAPGKMILIP